MGLTNRAALFKVGSLVEFQGERYKGCRVRVVDAIGVIGKEPEHQYHVSLGGTMERIHILEPECRLIDETKGATIQKAERKRFLNWLRKFTGCEYSGHSANSLAYVIVRLAEEEFRV